MFNNKLALYGIGSGIYQGIDGVGVDYRITDNIYKTYSMTTNYNYYRVSTGLKYSFK